jgi:manganese-dependent inorganic pyrophosphatase
MRAVVLPYVNPDLDGIASALAIEAVFGTPWEAKMFGEVDGETELVLTTLQISRPARLQSWDDIGEIWLVDTHHLRQLPADLPAERVVKITDHHPGGNPESFRNAEIQNERVGAVATLVAEKCENNYTAIPGSIAVLLQAAILSNTLEFRAPSTSSRDRSLYKMLQAVEPISTTLVTGMRERRRSRLNLSTESLVRSDTKVYDVQNGTIIVGQIEAPGASEVLDRSDLVPALESLAHEASASFAVFNVVDTAAGISGVVVTDRNARSLLAEALGAKTAQQQIIRVDRILQRKSDIVPILLRQNSSNSTDKKTPG